MEILSIVFVALFSGAGLVALLSALGLLMPDTAERTRLLLEASLGKAFLLGLVNFLFFFTIAALLAAWSIRLGSIPGGTTLFFAAIIVLALVVFSLAGLIGMTRLLGKRIGVTKSSFANDLRGGAILVLASLTPFVGWYVFAPFVLLTALGAAILALFQGKPAPTPTRKPA